MKEPFEIKEIAGIGGVFFFLLLILFVVSLKAFVLTVPNWIGFIAGFIFFFWILFLCFPE